MSARVSSYNAAMSALARDKQWRKALKILEYMIKQAYVAHTTHTHTHEYTRLMCSTFVCDCEYRICVPDCEYGCMCLCVVLVCGRTRRRTAVP